MSSPGEKPIGLIHHNNVCITLKSLMSVMQQPKLRISLAICLPCGCAGAFLKYYQNYISPGSMSGAITDNAAFEALNFLVLYLATFRIQAAYRKFWDGCDHAYGIVGDLCDAGADLIAFCRNTKGTPQEVENFQQLIIRLLSLLNAAIFAELESGADRPDDFDPDTQEIPNAYTFDLIDIQGIDEASLEFLLAEPNKVEVVFQWVQFAVMEACNKRLVAVPGPLVSVAMKDLNSAMNHFHEAQKITEVPFPFPFMLALQLLLVSHWFLTPVVTSDWTGYALWTFVFCNACTFTLWFVTGVTLELDMPFQHTANSIDVRYLQKLLNHRLLALTSTFKMATPHLSNAADMNLSRTSQESMEGINAAQTRSTKRSSIVGMQSEAGARRKSRISVNAGS
mmetsp:Transcript_19013/g.33492  ORF Transcript_19013/g.33492 Transcript_19013/m.33492 type:complete len:395 (-) Transcript_19013:227-1411(-)